VALECTADTDVTCGGQARDTEEGEYAGEQASGHHIDGF
jgi:hypothetical protein